MLCPAPRVHSLPSLNHNEIRDLTAHLLTEVCHQGGWNLSYSLSVTQTHFLMLLLTPRMVHNWILSWMDFAVVALNAVLWMFKFSFPAQSNVHSISAAYRRHKNIKWRVYGQRVREIEHASFTPIVMSATVGLAPEATTFYSWLASLLASKWGDDYSVVMGWLHCSLSFLLLRSAIACVCGARSSISHFHPAPPSLDLVRVESNNVTNWFFYGRYHRWWSHFILSPSMWQHNFLIDLM